VETISATVFTALVCVPVGNTIPLTPIVPELLYVKYVILPSALVIEPLVLVNLILDTAKLLMILLY
jgi:hypothetical protein